MKNFIPIILLLNTVVFTINAQISDEMIPQLLPATPDAAAMATYDNQTISKYTGKPNVQIPIYSIPFRDIEIPISISYNAQGFKPAEEPGVLGLGWTLHASAAIVRKINKFNDFP